MTLPRRRNDEALDWLQKLVVFITTRNTQFHWVAGGSLTLPYILSMKQSEKPRFVRHRETKGDFVSSFFHFHALPIWYFSCIIWVLHE